MKLLKSQPPLKYGNATVSEVRHYGEFTFYILITDTGFRLESEDTTHSPKIGDRVRIGLEWSKRAEKWTVKTMRKRAA